MLSFTCLLIILTSAYPIESSLITYSNYESLATSILYNYDYYYGNTNLLKFNIPSNVVYGLWYFQLQASSSCPSSKIYIYLDYAGYPVVAPLNESFPSTVNLNRLTKALSVSTVGGGANLGNQGVQFTVTSPNPGNWYASAFYIKSANTYSSNCYFFVTAATTINVNNATQIITANNPVFTLTTSLTFQIFKYLTTSNYNDPIIFNIYFNNTSLSCSLTALLSESTMPNTATYSNNDVYITCTLQSSNCSLSIQLPLINAWYYLGVSSNCNYTVNLNVNSLGITSPIKTTRFLSPSSFYSVFYLASYYNNIFTFNTDQTPYFIEFIIDQTNNGGTLSLNVAYKLISLMNSSSLIVNIQLNGCLMFNTLYNYINCPQGYSFNGLSNLTTFNSLIMDIPYPMIGKWYLALWRSCFSLINNQSVSCPASFITSTIVKISTNQCINQDCGSQGTCNIVNSQSNLISVCECSKGYQGYGCTEIIPGNSNQNNDINQVLFLTMSNLVFILPVLLALYRRWYIESLLYFYNMFFSTFYHACDQKNYYFCIFNYNGLQLADFISSYSSFSITILSMSEMPRPWKVFAYFLSVLVCMSIDLYNRFDTTAFIVIIILASVFTVATWAKIWYKTRKLFPSKKRLLLYIPGLVLAITGIVIFTKLQTDSNYWILHSIWHMLMAVSILFFMPYCQTRPLFKAFNIKPFFYLIKNFFKNFCYPKHNSTVSVSPILTSVSSEIATPPRKSRSLPSEDLVDLDEINSPVSEESQIQLEENAITRSVNQIDLFDSKNSNPVKSD